MPWHFEALSGRIIVQIIDDDIKSLIDIDIELAAPQRNKSLSGQLLLSNSSIAHHRLLEPDYAQSFPDLAIQPPKCLKIFPPRKAGTTRAIS